ncbi:hypothetical protein : Uncharacterized protein OS=Singulisphaera acidiphila (strain ATCC BAA-1392 / DSM 18658 / VKM B-2454 / MOB10) GN=Sinac_2425 PE=4 SV=1: DUF1501 [Gemmataceae bacterium]|nr:hypothetical protein : Uncharacterized protein OS=Singulisphaera acidiphila (strain ATCC BAA-1392 / DSM 18658 / VKM B-2454 / MOB10) GN=Sinac_2425 PE=4 SV=1: DUF1501 [Gemmataceae bacterium]VTT97627.1 hypothetical protein : Uncharacterized protein OS=Singulisphaera acidiphila (strain ATCC BAA-1392 / DSM 18658 / VKM B-2454 / MOB10) GN=Sinac_2425 PE=4 SV=1: DUF1501 [Gemmataceae bacterium]
MPPAPCPGPSRRDALALGAFGLTLPQLLAARETAPPRRPKACIVLFLLGAPPQQETWDPKPDAPVEARGDLGVIRSATPGLLLGETMVKTSRHTEKIAVLRAVSTNDNSHSSSGYYMTTGYPHAPVGVENAKPGAPNDWPSLGGVVRRVLQPHCKLPAAVTLPEQSANDGNLLWPGQDAGFLGRSADPWLLACEPEKGRFDVPGLTLPADVSEPRFDSRRQLLGSIDRLPASADERGIGAKAFELIASQQARKAFDLDSEDVRTRDRYGRSRFGQSCLLVRRLVESGVPLIRVNWTRVPNAPNNGHWDTHSKNTEGVKRLMPILDTAYTALLEDLSDRGMIDDTLVVWCAEFGRTPKLNGAGGRDHWGPVFSVALAGGGVKGGAVYGASDKLAAYPRDGRVTPQDLHATIYHCLGIPRDTEIRDAQGRPLPICRGEPVKAILG